jgi:hypothetical protein
MPPACTRYVEWYKYIMVSLVTFVGGLIVLAPARLFWYFCHGYRASDDSTANIGLIVNNGEDLDTASKACFRRLRAAALELQSGNHAICKIFVSVGR